MDVQQNNLLLAKPSSNPPGLVKIIRYGRYVIGLADAGGKLVCGCCIG
jgi:hypothetical protein